MEDNGVESLLEWLYNPDDASRVVSGLSEIFKQVDRVWSIISFVLPSIVRGNQKVEVLKAAIKGMLEGKKPR